MLFIEVLPKVHSCNIVPNVSLRSLRLSALAITECMDPEVYSGGEGEDFFCSSQTIPHSLNRFDTHLQARLSGFETKMAARKG